jgi:hypothetical protein
VSILNRKLKVSINPRLINKNEHKDASLFSKGWVNKSLTPDELAGEIDAGVAYCCQLNGPRKAANFLRSDVISVDIDGTRRIEDVMRDPIVERYLTIFYTTPSHTPESHRFRLVFALLRTIRSGAEMVAASRSLTLRLSGDRAATDAARVFFGSRGSKPQVFDRAIDESFLDELIEQGRHADQADTKGSAVVGTTVSGLAVEPDQIIVTAARRRVEFSQLAVGTTICCPFHHDTNASAFVLSCTARRAPRLSGRGARSSLPTTSSISTTACERSRTISRNIETPARCGSCSSTRTRFASA